MMNVVFGGGRVKFLPKNESDPGNANKKGDRVDGRNLINEWQEKMKRANRKHKVVLDKTSFDQLDPNENYDHVLALLSHSHMDYESDRVEKNPPEEPSLIEMTNKAIQILSKNPNGYFLLVEGGRIDHGT